MQPKLIPVFGCFLLLTFATGSCQLEEASEPPKTPPTLRTPVDNPRTKSPPDHPPSVGHPPKGGTDQWMRGPGMGGRRGTGDRRGGGRPDLRQMRPYSLPLNNPATVPAAEADHMKGDDPVLGLLVDGKARAYPWWIVVAYHVINDTFGTTPVYIAQCEVCSGSGAFRPEVYGRILDFTICGSKHGTFFVCDAQTRSQWYAFSGYAFSGPLAGKKLERLPLFQTTWSSWKADHPETDIIYSTRRLKERPHGQKQFLGKPHIVHQLAASIEVHDDRLKENELVFGLISGDHKSGRAYPVKEIRAARNIIQEEFEGQQIIVLHRPPAQIGAYQRTVDGAVRSFKLVSQDPFLLVDETKTEWNFWGQAVSGPDKGKQLHLADGYLAEWYEWVGHYPTSTIFSAQP